MSPFRGLSTRRSIQLGFLCVTLSLQVLYGSSLFSSNSALFSSNSDIAAGGTGISGMARRLLSSSENDELSNYPDDAFSKQQRQDGAAVLHALGVIYMFAALAIICDEFFVPSLDVICRRLDLQNDVAGATFMAAGGSAPELATSFVGTFVSQSNIGFGTIVGSAVFNILFVIGVCAIVAPSNIELQWWPLARDSSFYSLSLALLIACFVDRQVEGWEAAILLSVYILYVVFMRYNVAAERKFRQLIGLPEAGGSFDVELEHNRNKGNALSPATAMDLKSGTTRAANSQPTIKDITTIADAEEGNGLGATHSPTHPHMAFGVHTLFSSQRKERANSEDKAFIDKQPEPVPEQIPRSKRRWCVAKIKILSEVRKKKCMSDIVLIAMADPYALLPEQQSFLENKEDQKEHAKHQGECGSHEDDGGSDDDDEPMDLAWPSTCGKQVSYVILAPLTYLLYYTIPDVRREGWENYFATTFVMSILYIAFFSYFMVWWVTLLGDTLNIPSQIMGLTVLAIGTSVPDLLESVIVAKQGKGDMAVSSSIGSNIFDVTIGLPFPWLLYNLIYNTSIYVGTDGLFISVVLLFAMLLCCVSTIAFCGWKLTKSLGVVFLCLWVVFVGISIVVEVVV
eukprot:CAMPEP_0197518498 /NCGR_PEP_ID=MMETSP1318-20131121/3689_1 /TAXON_ID=552666 /ORGANISM="Partenskyella glossopodia, Strain RCC365" /LENGTH=624 /DNA_ID=CAMNT_0043068877 /DNA_START=336 /DNA_END=2210 /DNA_ORIENTATION=-